MSFIFIIFYCWFFSCVFLYKNTWNYRPVILWIIYFCLLQTKYFFFATSIKKNIFKVLLVKKVNIRQFRQIKWSVTKGKIRQKTVLEISRSLILHSKSWSSLQAVLQFNRIFLLFLAEFFWWVLRLLQYNPLFIAWHILVQYKLDIHLLSVVVVTYLRLWLTYKRKCNI